jgi:ABC-type uncharacterized transport system permease subunit
VTASLVFGTLAQAGLAINASVPKEAMGVLEAIVILLVAAAAYQGKKRSQTQPGDGTGATEENTEENTEGNTKENAQTVEARA